MRLKFLISILIIILTFALTKADEFYGYYTRTNYEDGISGKYADIIISYGEQGEVIFSRKTSYLPSWKTAKGTYYFEEKIERVGDGKGLRPDKFNRHSYVRIIQNNSKEIIVHWRYYSNILHTKMTDVVHEFFTFTPGGKVIREIKVGTENIDKWKAIDNTYEYQLELTRQGIKELSFSRSSYEKINTNIEGNPVLENNLEKTLAYFSMNEGLKTGGDSITESISGISAPVLGHKTYWTKGVSGTALKFDGYYSGVKLPVQYTPQISETFTIEAWINMAAHPFGWVPIVHQSNWEKSGYYLGVNAYGQLGFMCNINGIWRKLVTTDSIYVNKWHHIAVSWNIDSKQLRIYLDGELSAKQKVKYEGWEALIHANAPLSIGLNTDKLSALPEERFKDGQFPTITGWEGAIDEVKFYQETLSGDKIKSNYEKVISNATLKHNIFEERILPGNPGYADEFGAKYTQLSYHQMWDNAWRSSEYSDILVKFDNFPTSVAFWRGPSYGMGWVTDENLWMLDQSVEWGNPRSLVEHMSDKQGRYTHVRLIENTDARVVVHWRYNSCDVLYSFVKEFGDAGLWVDEYITIYPDGVGIRKVNQKADGWIGQAPDKVSWQDVQFASQPGMNPDEVMNLEAVHPANIKGETGKMDWSEGVPEKNPLPDANIERINFNSEYKVFLAFQEGTHINPWGGVDEDFYTHFMTWNHWPCAFINSAGKSSLFPTRITHSALCAADNVVDHGNMAMYGFTEQPVDSLVPLVRSWNQPPKVSSTTNCKSNGYDKAQRAYIFKREADKLKFEIEADESSPLVNPCFVIKNWKSNQKAKLSVNNKLIKIGKANRQGIVRDRYGEKMLIIWLEMSSDKNNQFEISSM